MTAPKLTVAEAARRVRATEDEIRQALDAGDLRNLTPAVVEAWGRARVAGVVARSQRP